jgi:hypothetical protein
VQVAFSPHPELNVVDLRKDGHPLNLYSYIEDYNPDLVLFIWSKYD